MVATSRLTTKYQATIPLAVRRALNLKAGDRVRFDVRGDRAVITRASPVDDETLVRLAQSHTMREWNTPEDDEAFRDL